MVEDAPLYARACVGISTKGLTKTADERLMEKHRFVSNTFDCVCYFVLGHLPPPLAVAARVCSRSIRVVKLNYETKLSAYIGYVCAYVGRSCAKGGVSPSFGLRIIFRFGYGRGKRLEGEKLDETGIGNPLLSRDLTRRSREEVIFRGRVFYHRATFFFFLADKNDQYDQVDKYWICARVNETNVINI